MSDGTRTPSGWHDDASNRDAGHDEMQAMVYRHLCQNRTIERNGRQYRSYAAGVEYAFVEKGRLIGFADVGVFHKSDDFDEAARRRYSLWVFAEVKPRIYSVGALIRQCEATVILAKRAGIEVFEVCAYVYDDDPKLALLREVCRFDVVAFARPAVQP